MIETKQHCFEQSQSHFCSSHKNALPCMDFHIFNVKNTISQYTMNGKYIKCDNWSSREFIFCCKNFSFLLPLSLCSHIFKTDSIRQLFIKYQLAVKSNSVQKGTSKTDLRRLELQNEIFHEWWSFQFPLPFW